MKQIKNHNNYFHSPDTVFILAIRNNITCYEIYNKIIEDNEIIGAQLETSSESLLVASIYIPPKVKIQHELFEHLYNLNNSCLLLGDLNATLHSMGSKRANTKEHQLQQILDEGYLQCIVLGSDSHISILLFLLDMCSCFSLSYSVFSFRFTIDSYVFGFFLSCA